MLSVKPIKSAGEAAEYFFEKDNLYGKDIPEDKASWWGRGAQLLNLTGNINREDFQNLLEGKLSPTLQLGKWLNGEIAHRPGFDLTFSAPKSFSILAEVYGFEFLKQVHNRAVKQTLGYIESECSQTRVTREGEKEYQNTGNLVAALFEHDTSRDLDPHVHSHAVIMNATLCADGKWRSLASQNPAQNLASASNGFYEQILERQRHYGAIYRANLAYILKQEYGYQITQTHTDGRFEICGIDSTLIKHFSKRREAIEEFLTKRNLNGARAASFAALETRDAKTVIDRDKLRGKWQEQAKVLGFNPEKVEDILVSYRSPPTTYQRNNINEKHAFNPSPYSMALDKLKRVSTTIIERILGTSFTQQRDEKNNQNALAYAIEFLSENNVILSETHLLNIALTHDLGNVSPEGVLKAINKAKKTGDLVRLDKPGQVTTHELLKYEREIIKMLERGLDSAEPIGYRDEVNAFVETQHHLIAEQQLALAGILQSTNRLQGLIGAAGTGKTEIINVLSQFAQQQGFTTIGLTTSAQAARDLHQQLSIPTKTLSSYTKLVGGQLKRSKEPLDANRTLLIIDNANLASSRQLFEIVKISEKTNAHLVMVGDKHAPLPTQAGNPLLQLIDRGLPRYQLQRLHRGETQAISASLAGKLEAVFEKLGERIIGIADINTRLNAIAYQAAHTPNTVVLLPTIAERDKVNIFVREQLKQLGSLQQKASLVDVLVPCYLKQAQYRLAKSYKENQIIRFNQSITSLGIQKNDYYVIVAKDTTKNELILNDATGKEISWQPYKINRQRQGVVQVYNQEKREISIGERIAWTQNAEEGGLYNGTLAKVIAINKETIKLQLQEKLPTFVTLSLKDMTSKHFDYAYATTYSKGYHQIADVIITHQASKVFSTNQRSLYRQLGQARGKLFLYTDDKKTYLQTVQLQTGNKISAIEALLKATQDLSATGLEAAIEERLKASREYRDTPEIRAKSALAYAVAHFSEREAIFEKKALYKKALEYSFGSLNSQLLNAALHYYEEKGEVVRCLKPNYWTTKKAIETEKEILKMAEEGIGNVMPIAAKDAIDEYLAASPLSDEQKQAASFIARSRDRFVQIQGYAGTGKTALLKTLQNVCMDNGYQLIGIAPTYSAVKELRKQDIAAKTLEGYLNEASQQLPMLNNKQTLIVVDEASMISNTKYHALQKLVIESNGRLLSIGDRRQLGSFGDGKPFELVQQSAAKTATLKNIKRQRDPTLLSAVKKTIEGDFSSAIQLLSKQINEEAIKSKRLEQLADNYLSRSVSLRERTLVITPANDDREVVNSLIRDGLKNEGSVYGQGVETRILVPKSLTKAESTLACHYKPNEVVRFNMGSKILGIEKNSYYRVNSHDNAHNVVMLQNIETEKEIAWLPHEVLGGRYNATEVYQVAERELAIGDKLHWTRASKTKGLSGLTLATIKKIEGDVVTVQLATDQDYSFSIKDTKEQHIDHAYAITVFRAQGKTALEIISHEESTRKFLTNQRGFYVAVTRAIQQVTIYTDNKDKLIQRILENTGVKASALEAIGHLKDKKTTKLDAMPSKQQFTKLGIETHKPNYESQTITKQDWQTLFQAMNDHAESIIKDILGEPNLALSNNASWRYGKKGSLAISLDKDKRGLWHNFETSEKGNLFQLLQKHTGLTKDNLYKHYANKVGLTRSSKKAVAIAKAEPLSVESKVKEQSLSHEQKKKIEYANKLMSQSQDIKGTLAERYLKEHRGIKKAIPESFRFHPNLYSRINNKACPALLVIAKDRHGRVQAVQAIYLDSKSAQKANVNVPKQTFGVMKNALVEIHRSKTPTDLVLIAEGPETGLSLREAIANMNIKVSLSISNFSSINANTSEKNVVLCLDNDGKNPATAKLIDHSVKYLRDESKNVWINKPHETNKDYNDILREQGVKSVYDYIYSSKNCQENNSINTTLKEHLHNTSLTVNMPYQKSNVNSYTNKHQQLQKNLNSQPVLIKATSKIKELV